MSFQESRQQKKLAAEILKRLNREYPDAGPQLHFSNPYQALVATILSAQTTDQQVNRVTIPFFAKYPDIESLAGADLDEVAEIIRSVGLYRSKAAHLVAAAKMIIEEYGGKVPADFDSLLKLPGVGRKTANVILANAFGKPGLGVDTHVQRVANRIGICAEKRPEGTEKKLKELILEKNWGKAHHLLIFHGRLVCKARKPKCSCCVLKDICKSAQKYT